MTYGLSRSAALMGVAGSNMDRGKMPTQVTHLSNSFQPHRDGPPVDDHTVQLRRFPVGFGLCGSIRAPLKAAEPTQ